VVLAYCPVDELRCDENITSISSAGAGAWSDDPVWATGRPELCAFGTRIFWRAAFAAARGFTAV